MMVSAELRWFWQDNAPPDFAFWFFNSPAHAFPVGGGQPRMDDYLIDPDQSELGIKARGGKSGIEVKGLVFRAPEIMVEGPFRGQVEVWSKWTSQRLSLDRVPNVSTTKTRWMRKFDTAQSTPREIELGSDEKPLHEDFPSTGCNVEFTKVEISKAIWWTFGFECFGDLELVAQELLEVVRLLVERQPPDLGDAIFASYPAWLNHNA